MLWLMAACLPQLLVILYHERKQDNLNFKGSIGVVSSDPPVRESHIGFTIWFPCNLHLSKNEEDIVVFLSYVINSDYFLPFLENHHCK